MCGIYVYFSTAAWAHEKALEKLDAEKAAAAAAEAGVTVATEEEEEEEVIKLQATN